MAIVEIGGLETILEIRRVTIRPTARDVIDHYKSYPPFALVIEMNILNRLGRGAVRVDGEQFIEKLGHMILGHWIHGGKRKFDVFDLPIDHRAQKAPESLP